MRTAAALLALLLLAGTAVGKESRGALIGRLDSENPVVRVEAVDALTRHRGPKVLVALLLALRDDAPEVRAHAAEALRVVGDPRAVPFLSRALTDAEPTVRCRVVLTLGALADRYIVPSLTRSLSDGAVIVRAAAIRALGEIGDPLSLRPILSALRREESDLNGSVTAAALISAAKLDPAKGIARVAAISGERIEKLWFLRAALARAIGIALDRGRADRLVAMLDTDPDLRVVQAAASSLGLLGMVEPLATATESEETFRRWAAVGGLAQVPAAAALPILVRMVNDPEPSVVLQAADSLAARGRVDALPVLIRLLDVDHPAWMGALASLRHRTGLDIDRNPPRWRDWYERNRERLVFREESGTFRVVR